MKILALALLLIASPALAQETAYTPPDQELWTQMSQAFSQLNMPLATHQQVQQIMQTVEQQARQKAAAKKLPESPKENK